MKIAAIQTVSAPDLATNLATAERLIDQTATDGAQSDRVDSLNGHGKI
jgi:predicted amidohydrolase